MVKVQPRMRQMVSAKHELILCPECGYDCHYSMGVGQTETGVDPQNLKLECGRCRLEFYEFL